MTREDLITTIEEAIDNVHDMGVTSRDYAVSIAAALGPVLDAADALAEAAHHERNMPCQDIDMQMSACEAVDVALSTYRAAKEALQ